jgi:hypothetical protein
VSLGQSRGRASIPGGETVERLDEDAARASRFGTEKSADCHLETDLMPEDRLLGETASITAVDPPSLMTADRTGCVRSRRRNPETQGEVIEVGADQATAGGSTQKLGQEQGTPPKR